MFDHLDGRRFRQVDHLAAAGEAVARRSRRKSGNASRAAPTIASSVGRSMLFPTARRRAARPAAARRGRNHLALDVVEHHRQRQRGGLPRFGSAASARPQREIRLIRPGCGSRSSAAARCAVALSGPVTATTDAVQLDHATPDTILRSLASASSPGAIWCSARCSGSVYV